jgi:HK97 gp10 family phage protein
MRLTTRGQLRFRTRDIEKQYQDHAKLAVFRGTAMVRETVLDMILRYPKTGPVSRRRGVTHQASAPGQPPATDTGFLARNIYSNIDSDGLGGSVESRAPYSSYLEFGTAKMAARPFMFPALEMNKPKIRAMFKKLR